MNSLQSMCQRAFGYKSAGTCLLLWRLRFFASFSIRGFLHSARERAMKKLLEYEISNLHRTDFAARFSRKSGFPDTASHHLNGTIAKQLVN